MSILSTRRSALILLGAVILPSAAFSQSADGAQIKIYKDPSCSCCGNWAKHLRLAGFETIVEETTEVATLKTRLGVPDDLASCHTAVIDGYAIEGHVPAEAIKQLLVERPKAIGLAVPGMPSGAPGMEAPGVLASADPYEVILFGLRDRSTYMRFRGSRRV
jgi:hypothetical protein